MANKKAKAENTAIAPETALTDTENVETADAAVKTDSKKAGYVSYCLPFLPGKEPGDSHTVTVNGKNYQVQYGERVEVPIAVRDILEEMIAQSRLVSQKMRQMEDNDQCIAKFKK